MRIASIIAIILVLLFPYFIVDGSVSAGVSAAALQSPPPGSVAEEKISPDVTSRLTTLTPGGLALLLSSDPGHNLEEQANALIKKSWWWAPATTALTTILLWRGTAVLGF